MTSNSYSAEIIAFGIVQATASSESEAEAKRDRWQRQINAYYRGPELARVVIRKTGSTPPESAAPAGFTL